MDSFYFKVQMILLLILGTLEVLKLALPLFLSFKYSIVSFKIWAL